MEATQVNRQQLVARSLMDQFFKTLEKAAWEAQQIHNLAVEAGDEIEWKGTENLELSGKLQEIYAAFATGDKADRSHNDEIFKG